jgi:hypothetical protein
MSWRLFGRRLAGAATPVATIRREHRQVVMPSCKLERILRPCSYPSNAPSARLAGGV